MASRASFSCQPGCILFSEGGKSSLGGTRASFFFHPTSDAMATFGAAEDYCACVVILRLSGAELFVSGVWEKLG